LKLGFGPWSRKPDHGCAADAPRGLPTSAAQMPAGNQGREFLRSALDADHRVGGAFWGPGTARRLARHQFLVKTPDLLIWEIPSSRMPASVPSDPHRSPNSVDCHIDRGPLRGLLSHPSQALMACNESGPRT
jgi:hypothetical protein